jgi:hypothetical protein
MFRSWRSVHQQHNTRADAPHCQTRQTSAGACVNTNCVLPIQSSHSTAEFAMDPPNMDNLQLSDSDSDALFDTPAARKNKTKTQEEQAHTAGAKARGKESHYTTEEAREVALKRELESVRNVNKVIEGVVESLEKARNNMDVCIGIQHKDVTVANIPSRRCRAPYTMHQPCSRRGPVSSLKQNTISG